jgi:hypothetical protein
MHRPGSSISASNRCATRTFGPDRSRHHVAVEPPAHDQRHAHVLLFEAKRSIEARVLLREQADVVPRNRVQQSPDHFRTDAFASVFRRRPHVDQVRVGHSVCEEPRRADDSVIDPRYDDGITVGKGSLELLGRAPIVEVVGGEIRFERVPINTPKIVFVHDPFAHRDGPYSKCRMHDVDESVSFAPMSTGRSRLKAVCIDCSNPASLARWWADVLEWRVRPYSDEDLTWLRDQGYEGPDDDPAVAVDPPHGAGPTLWFNRVPEPKTVKNRVHLDVYADVDDLQTKGASVLYGHGEQPDTDWAVLADPEGNEFCVFRGDR